ncbi:MAG TPA: TonB family protein, partial [Pyrinomonadaceae bacterium]|nr:TonB family protein [Pyrinomonadaceae bacterium]
SMPENAARKSDGDGSGLSTSGTTTKSDDDDFDKPVVVKTPAPTPKPVPKVISGGVVNGKATNLVKPPYPAAARAVRASGAVNVQVTIDENGSVISASAVSGHPLLRAAAVQAARSSRFSPTLLSGQPVKVTGVIVYNFQP